MSDHPASPELAIGGLALSASGERAAVLMGERVRLYDLVAGRRVAEHSLSGPSLALSPSGRWLAATDGAVRDALTGELRWRAPFSGLVYFLSDERLLLVGVGQLLAIDWRTGWELASLFDDALDPSGAARIVAGPGGLLALVDPAGDALALIDPGRERLVDLGQGCGPASDAAFDGGALLAVQDGGLSAWDLRSGARAATARPHGNQTLAVAAGPAGPVTAGIEVDGRFTLRIGPSVIALPGPPPPSPTLIWTAGGWLVELWSGLALVGPEGIRRHCVLPLQRGGARPLRAARPMAAAGDRLLLACDPLTVYDLALGFQARLEPEPQLEP